MKRRFSKTQKTILQWLADQGGEGYVVTGYRRARVGWTVKDGHRVPVLACFGQAFDPLWFNEPPAVERVGGFGTHKWRALYTPDGHKK